MKQLVRNVDIEGTTEATYFTININPGMFPWWQVQTMRGVSTVSIEILFLAS